jgi:Phosphotransferase enzyme family
VPDVGPDDVTGEWLSEVFGTAVEMRGQDRIGDGLVGMNIRVGLSSAEPDVPESVVIKLPSPDETSRMTGIALRNYERESKFYNEVAATIDMHVPRCYHSEWTQATGDFVIVLEDLAPAEQGNQLTGCTIDVARTSVLELARLHGPRWDDPTLADIEWLSRNNGPQDTMMLVGMWGMVFAKFIETYGKYLDDDRRALLDRFGPRLGGWVDGRDGPLTVTHGDYRLDNLMFATDAGGAPITAVDWQTPGHGSGLSDVSYFLGAGPLPDDRALIERELVAEYAEVLRTEYAVSIDDAWAWDQYRRDAFAGVVMAVIASQLVGGTERSEGMFAAMATRHLQHALDLDSEALI